jgi:hypothetical protein
MTVSDLIGLYIDQSFGPGPASSSQRTFGPARTSAVETARDPRELQSPGGLFLIADRGSALAGSLDSSRAGA